MLMTHAKSGDPVRRKNITLRRSVIEMGEDLKNRLHKESFSELVRCLIIEDRERRHLKAGEPL